jgi:peptide/nickel transport system permease protein
VTAWLVRRVAASMAIVFAVVTLTFLLIHLAPGQPFLPGSETPIDPAVVNELRHQFGLDRSLAVQYVKYLGALAHGNLGQSFALHRPVADALADAIPNTLVLTGAALCIDLLCGLALGVYQAVRARRFPDIGLGYLTLFFNSVPTFWLGLLLLLVFGEWLRWVPVGGVIDPVLHAALPWAGRTADRLWHLVLPGLTLGLVGAAGTARYQRAAVLEVIGQDFVRTARAKGLRERRVVLVHTLRNAVLPLVTLFGLSLPFLLTGAVLVETVFAWPGMGRLAAEAIFRRDYPVVMAAAICASVLVVLGNLVADVLYAVADPRIRVQDG